MKDSFVVRHGERSPGLPDDFRGPIDRYPLSLDLRTQTDAVDELHHEVRLAVRQFSGVEDSDNAWMVHARECLFLLLKLLDHPRISQRLVEQDLNDDAFVVQLPIARQ